MLKNSTYIKDKILIEDGKNTTKKYINLIFKHYENYMNIFIQKEEGYILPSSVHLFLIVRAGTPATISHSTTSFVTTEPAPITT